MFQGFPRTVSAPAPSDEIDIQAEIKNEEGMVLAFELPPIDLVQIDLSVVLRISKLSEENFRAFGQVLGMQIGSQVEITNILPTWLRNKSENINDDDHAKRTQMLEAETRKCYEAAHFDTYSVGRYASCPHDQYFTRHNIETMMEGLRTGHPCLLLVFDRLRTNMGKLYMKAYVPTNEFLAMHRASLAAPGGHGALDNAAIIANNVDVAGILREVPVQITTTVLHKLFLSKLATRPRNVRDKILGHSRGLDKYTESSMRYLGDEMEKLQNDIQQRTKQVQAEQANGTGAHVPLKVETRTLMLQMQSQATHVASIAATMAINADFAQKL